MTALRRFTLLLQICTLPLLGAACGGDTKDCPPGERLVGRAYGAHCEKDPSGGTGGDGSPQSISGVSFSDLNIVSDECFTATNRGIYNTNSFPVLVAVSAAPIPPGWPISGKQTFTVPPQTSVGQPLVIGKTNYKSVEDCRLINYRIETVSQSK